MECTKVSDNVTSCVTTIPAQHDWLDAVYALTRLTTSVALLLVLIVLLVIVVKRDRAEAKSK